MRNILRLRVLGILLLALGLFGGTAVNVAAQDDDVTPPAGTPGTITIAAFLSEAVSGPVLAGEFIPAADGAAPADVDFDLYFTNKSQPAIASGNTSGGAVVIDDLPLGTYVLALDFGSVYGTADYTIVLAADAPSAFLTFLVPAGETPGVTDTACIVLSSFGAEAVDELTWLVSAPYNLPPSGDVLDLDIVIGEANYDIPYVGAYPVDREFTLLIGGVSSQFNRTIQTVGGVGVLCGIPDGTHRLIDTQTGVGVELDTLTGNVTVVTAVFPEGTGDTGDSDGDPDTEAPDGADSGDGEDDGDGDGDGDGDTAGSGDVSKLPSTGQGSSTDSSAIVLILGAMSLVALAGGFAWRQRRSA
jgi:MYXO-CTERM domain-containing protein